MEPWYPPILIGLVLYVLLVQLLTLIDRSRRRVVVTHAPLPVMMNGKDGEVTPSELYLASYGQLQRKWLQLTGPYGAVAFVLGAFLFLVIHRGGETVFVSLWMAIRITGGSLLGFLLLILIVSYLFGRRVGGVIYLYADWGIAQEGLLYRPFTTWRLIPWPTVAKISGPTFALDTIKLLRIYIRRQSILPGWYQRYLWGKAAHFPLLLDCGLPKWQELVRSICRHTGQTDEWSQVFFAMKEKEGLH